MTFQQIEHRYCTVGGLSCLRTHYNTVAYGEPPVHINWLGWGGQDRLHWIVRRAWRFQ